MHSEHIKIPTADGTADAYFVRPDPGDPAPAVLIYTDAFGLRPVFERMAHRLAAAGYAVLVPNVYYRNGVDPVNDLPDPIDLTARPDLLDVIRPLMKSLDVDTISRDADAYLTFLADSPGVIPGPVAAIGYCMGTRLALRTAAVQPGLVAAVAAFHGGGLATDAPDSPHLDAGKIRAEIYLGHADHDQGMPPEQITRLNQALDDAGVRRRTEIYANAPHGFSVADTTAYREWAAERHFVELLSLLRRKLLPAGTN